MKPKQSNAAGLLKRKRQTLINRYLKGIAPDFLSRHANVIDDYFRDCFESSQIGLQMNINKNPYAIVAVGGYGRQEQCIHSDVDLLFLFEKQLPPEAELLIQEIIYPLWDLGFEVGYATRSLNDCLRLADRDFDILVPLLDARFICGQSHLYSELMNRLRHNVIQNRSRQTIDWLLQKNQARHFQFGDSSYLLEPNLKEGQGGLRDYHTMLWIARIEFNLKQTQDLLYLGLLSHDEFQSLTQALDFIWHVRNRIHYVCGKKCDQLHFENQIKLAKTLKYKKVNGQAAVEQFLGELHARMEYLKQQHLMFLYELGLEKRRRRRRKSRKKSNVAGIEVIEWGKLNFKSPEAIVKSPTLLIRIFEESARLKTPLSAEPKRLVKEFSHLVDKKFRSSNPIVESFEKVLLAPAATFNVHNEMLNTGFLVKFLPDFRGILNRIQYDEYHVYPVDKHALRTVQTIKKFGAVQESLLEPLCGKLCKGLRNKRLLLWAALLHDIGKGASHDGHADIGANLVQKILKEKGLNPKDIETIAFLVRAHLLLVETATRRDLHDEETAIFCARKAKDVNRLKMLYLLTVADSISTGPMAWNEWKATILRDFFLKVFNILEKKELASQEAVDIVEDKKNKVMSLARGGKEKNKLAALFEVMSPRYLLYTRTDDLSGHIQLYTSLNDKEFVWNIERPSDANTRTVSICAQDRPGLISKIAGVFTLNNIDILDVQVFTWRNSIALDIFKVKPPPDQLFEDEKWRRAEENLKDALAGQLDLRESLKKKISSYRSCKPRVSKKPHRIVIDNTGSSFFTIVEVYTYNFPGLLFSITDALFRCDLNIWVAKIATKADQVVDVFYVRDLNGQKVDTPQQESKIKAAILQRLPDSSGLLADQVS
jgi:[protein-PII] uridylyltransferase